MITLLFSCAQEPLQIDGMIRIEMPDGYEYFIDVYEYPNIKGEFPTAMLSFEKAADLCTALDKRLCTAQEWRYACQSGTNRRYVYGETYQQDRCFSNQPLEEGHTSLIHNKRAYATSGEYSSCVTTTGIFDMVGNLEEWVTDDWKGNSANLEGGAWYTYRNYADCTGRYSRQPDYRLSLDRPIDSAGVRCCWSKSLPTSERIAADSINRLEQAKNLSSTAQYHSADEVQLPSGIWIDRYEYPNKKGEMPVVAVSWEEATQICTTAGKRLCTAQEWELACSGTEQTPYPYGKAYKEGACADERDTPLSSGSLDDCKSDLGIFDLTGSVWEWTSTDLTVSELQNAPQQRLKEVRGGSWYSDAQKASCKPTVGYPTAPSNEAFPDVGFRCCRGTSKLMTARAQASEFTCPQNMINIENGCIDQYEYPNQKGSYPTSKVNHQDAIQLCQQQGKHLCSAQEWTTACEGPEQHRWSYGNEYVTDRCNHNADVTRGSALPSGSFTTCHTKAMIYDLTGNLWEWTKDGFIRGGNWNFSEGMGQCTSKAKPLSTIRSHKYGFRCCATADEARILLEKSTRQ